MLTEKTPSANHRKTFARCRCAGATEFFPTASASMPRIELCNASDIDAGTALRVESGELALAVFNVDGEFFVTDDACTHGPGSLSEGYIEGDIVECNFHNGQFNIKTGEVVSPPCMIPVKTYRTIVADGKVFIEI
jgi:nitrite reductase/ring-hydroxylating ferredoxin subunit